LSVRSFDYSTSTWWAPPSPPIPLDPAYHKPASTSEKEDGEEEEEEEEDALAGQTHCETTDQSTTCDLQPDVWLANFDIVHQMWHQTEAEFRGHMRKIAARAERDRKSGRDGGDYPTKEQEQQQKNDGESEGGQTFGEGNSPRRRRKPPLRLWLNAPAVVSEREEHDTYERAQIFNAIVREALAPYGWIEIDWNQMTLARAYDSTHFNDGMHAAPNTLRVLVHMLVHFLCH
jgi:hypothetical protein